MRFDIEKLTQMKVIDLGDLYIRPVSIEDAQDLFEYGKDEEVTQFLTWGPLKTVDDAKFAIKEYFLSRPQKGMPIGYAIVCKENQKMIGTCDLVSVDWENLVGEIGYVLHKAYWNKGYMTRILHAVIQNAFDDLGLEKIEISHMSQNIASQRVIEKTGFTFVKEAHLDKVNSMAKFYELKK